MFLIIAPIQRDFHDDCLKIVAAYSTRSLALEACQPFTFSLMMEMVGEALGKSVSN